MGVRHIVRKKKIKPIVESSIEEQCKIMYSKTNSKIYEKFTIPIVEPIEPTTEPIKEEKKESNWGKIVKWLK